MSCFSIYDYAVQPWEVELIKEMCNNTIEYYYGKCKSHFVTRFVLFSIFKPKKNTDRSLYSYPDTTILFYPFTDKFTSFDISGHAFHAAPGDGLKIDTPSGSTKVNYVTGPTGVKGTAASLGTSTQFGFYRKEGASLA